MSTKWPHRSFSGMTGTLSIDLSQFIDDAVVEEVVDEMEEVDDNEVDPKQSEPLHCVYHSLD